MTRDATLRDHLAAALADGDAAWSLGAFGAAAEFHRRSDEPFAVLGEGRLGLRTRRGGIALRLPPGSRPFAYEMPVGDGWSHAVALCLPETAPIDVPRTVLTEFGPDSGALDPAQRDAALFDLGLGLSQVAACVRTREAGLLARLRSALGEAAPDFDAGVLPEVAAGRADLIFAGPLGRVEILAGGIGVLPGPRAHVVPRILRLGRAHAATAPIPRGLVPYAHLYPAHPCRDPHRRPIPFDRARHDAFQAMLARWGDPRALALKAQCAGAGSRPKITPDRWTRAVERVARMQSACIAGAAS